MPIFELPAKTVFLKRYELERFVNHAATAEEEAHTTVILYDLQDDERQIVLNIDDDGITLKDSNEENPLPPEDIERLTHTMSAFVPMTKAIARHQIAATGELAFQTTFPFIRNEGITFDTLMRANDTVTEDPFLAIRYDEDGDGVREIALIEASSQITFNFLASNGTLRLKSLQLETGEDAVYEDNSPALLQQFASITTYLQPAIESYTKRNSDCSDCAWGRHFDPAYPLFLRSLSPSNPGDGADDQSDHRGHIPLAMDFDSTWHVWDYLRRGKELSTLDETYSMIDDEKNALESIGTTLFAVKHDGDEGSYYSIVHTLFGYSHFRKILDETLRKISNASCANMSYAEIDQRLFAEDGALYFDTSSYIDEDAVEEDAIIAIPHEPLIQQLGETYPERTIRLGAYTLFDLDGDGHIRFDRDLLTTENDQIFTKIPWGLRRLLPKSLPSEAFERGVPLKTMRDIQRPLVLRETTRMQAQDPLADDGKYRIFVYLNNTNDIPPDSALIKGFISLYNFDEFYAFPSSRDELLNPVLEHIADRNIPVDLLYIGTHGFTPELDLKDKPLDIDTVVFTGCERGLKDIQAIGAQLFAHSSGSILWGDGINMPLPIPGVDLVSAGTIHRSRFHNGLSVGEDAFSPQLKRKRSVFVDLK